MKRLTEEVKRIVVNNKYIESKKIMQEIGLHFTDKEIIQLNKNQW